MLLLLVFYVAVKYLVNGVVISMLRLRYEPKKLLLFALLQGTSLYVVRDVLGLFGTHIIVQTIIHASLFYFILNIPVWSALIVRGIGLGLVVLGELTVGQAMIAAFGVTHEQIMTNALLRFGIGLTSYVPVAICGIIVYYRARRLNNNTVSRSEHESEGQNAN